MHSREEGCAPLRCRSLSQAWGTGKRRKPRWPGRSGQALPAIGCGPAGSWEPRPGEAYLSTSALRGQSGGTCARTASAKARGSMPRAAPRGPESRGTCTGTPSNRRGLATHSPRRPQLTEKGDSVKGFWRHSQSARHSYGLAKPTVEPTPTGADHTLQELDPAAEKGLLKWAIMIAPAGPGTSWNSVHATPRVQPGESCEHWWRRTALLLRPRELKRSLRTRSKAQGGASSLLRKVAAIDSWAHCPTAVFFRWRSPSD